MQVNTLNNKAILQQVYSSIMQYCYPFEVIARGIISTDRLMVLISKKLDDVQFPNS